MTREPDPEKVVMIAYVFGVMMTATAWMVDKMVGGIFIWIGFQFAEWLWK